jgi:hypothetical protein
MISESCQGNDRRCFLSEKLAGEDEAMCSTGGAREDDFSYRRRVDVRLTRFVGVVRRDSTDRGVSR